MVKEADSRRAPREGGRSRGQEGGGSFWLCKSGGILGVGVGPRTGCWAGDWVWGKISLGRQEGLELKPMAHWNCPLYRKP